jgi:hypothetical protein
MFTKITIYISLGLVLHRTRCVWVSLESVFNFMTTGLVHFYVSAAINVKSMSFKIERYRKIID